MQYTNEMSARLDKWDPGVRVGRTYKFTWTGPFISKRGSATMQVLEIRGTAGIILQNVDTGERSVVTAYKFNNYWEFKEVENNYDPGLQEGNWYHFHWEVFNKPHNAIMKVVESTSTGIVLQRISGLGMYVDINRFKHFWKAEPINNMEIVEISCT